MGRHDVAPQKHQNSIRDTHQLFSISSITPKNSGDSTTASLKMRMVSLVTLELYTSDLYKIKIQLEEKTKQGQDFFKNVPLLLNLKNLEENVDIYWLHTIYALVKKHSFLPVGITGGSEGLEQAALAEGIAIWATGKGDRPAQEEPAPEDPLMEELLKKEQPEAVAEEVSEPVEQVTETEPEKEEAPVEVEPTASRDTEVAAKDEEKSYKPTQMVFQPVRSGQRIYAKGGDLIVMAAVNTGAEVMADGNIHIYGTLRGRALAGVAGWEGARIFCQDLRADLVAIAGYYTINEDLPQDKMNRAVQISLDNESLNVDLLQP